MIGNYVYAAFSICIGICIILTNYFFIFFLFGIIFILYMYKYHSIKIMMICLSIFCISIIYTVFVEKNNISEIPIETTQFVGIVDSIPIIDGNKLRFVYKINNEKVQVTYTIKSEDEQKFMTQMNAGMYVQINGTLEQPNISKNDNAFDYYQYLRQQHIHYLLKPTNINLLEQSSNNIKYKLLQVRQHQIDLIENNFTEISAPFVEALIFGERSAFDMEVENNYQELGLIHLLAISGSHISLLIVGGYLCLLRIGLTKSKSTIVLLIVLPMYMVLAGASPSVVRASIVGIIVLISFFIKTKLLAIDFLSIALIIMLLYNPYSLLNVGFQLSFVISFCLIVSSSYLSTLTPVMLSLAVTIIAQLAAIPISLFNFYELSFLSIPLNLLFVPFISFVVFPLSLISLIIFQIPIVSNLVIQLLDILIIISNNVLAIVASFPSASIIFGKPDFFWIILFYVVTIIFFFKLEQRKSIWITLICMCGLLLFQYVDTDRITKITFIDVGQGDCIFIQLNTENYLIDTGGTVSLGMEEWEKTKEPFEVGKDTVVPYLKSIGIRKLDKLIITHGDQDHIGGATAVFNDLKVEELILGKKDERSNLELQLIKIATQNDTKVTEVGSGNSWENGNSHFQVLSPFGDEVEENSRSIVIYVNIGNYKWLFTGDLDTVGEERIIEKYNMLDVDVLKVGHHGSKTSTGENLLQVTTPTVAIISVGENNRYGHPNEEVIDRLDEQIVLRTDELGMITYEYVDRQGTFSSHLSYDAVSE